MNLRFFVLLLSGLASFGWGAIVLGLRFLEGIAIALPVVVAAVLALLLGVCLLWWVRRASRPAPPSPLTKAGLALLALFVLGFILVFAIGILKVPPLQRGSLAIPAIILLAVVVALLGRLLGFVGFPIQRPSDDDRQSRDTTLIR